MKLTRRSVLTAAIAAPLLVACGTDSDEKDPAKKAPLFDAKAIDDGIAVLERSNSARIGIAVHRPGGDSYAHRGDELFAMCSTFKAYAAGALLRQVAAGKASLDATVTIDPAAVVANSPVTGQANGKPLTYTQLCEAALQLSDNTAGNYLLKAISGPPAITAFARSLGDNSTRLDRWETELNTAIPGDPRDTTTPRALATGFEKLLVGDALPAAQRDRLLEWMRGSKTSATRIRASLPQGWTAADKTGSGDYAETNDAGVVWDRKGNPLIITILTTTTTGKADATAKSTIIADAAAAVVRGYRGEL